MPRHGAIWRPAYDLPTIGQSARLVLSGAHVDECFAWWRTRMVTPTNYRPVCSEGTDMVPPHCNLRSVTQCRGSGKAAGEAAPTGNIVVLGYSTSYTTDCELDERQSSRDRCIRESVTDDHSVRTNRASIVVFDQS